MKGKSGCHIYTEQGRRNHERIFGRREKKQEVEPGPDGVGPDDDRLYENGAEGSFW